MQLGSFPVDCLYVFSKVDHPGSQVATLLTRIPHILVQTCFVLFEIIFSDTLVITLITLVLLEAAVVLLLDMASQMNLKLRPVFTLITV